MFDKLLELTENRKLHELILEALEDKSSGIILLNIKSKSDYKIILVDIILKDSTVRFKIDENLNIHSLMKLEERFKQNLKTSIQKEIN